jgi:hypothetical protein
MMLLDFDPFGWFFGSVFGIIAFIVGLVIYFIPTIIAIMRHHRNLLAIILINIFLGWTFVGWIVSLIWAIVG